MLTETLTQLYTRELTRLKAELSQYSDQKNIWIVDQDITNSAGNLCLHLVGNLRHFIGAVLGDTGYVRNREEEFGLKDVPRIELLLMVDDTIADIELTLSELSESQLSETYPKVVFKGEMTIEWFLIHLASHLGYHLGQVNYHRRLLD